jgi:dipeptidase E
MKFVFVSHGINEVARKKLIALAGKNTKLLLIDTPAKTYIPSPPWLIESIDELIEIGFKVDRFDIEDAHYNKVDLATKFKEYGVVAVSGGNVFYFLYWAEKVGLKKILEDYLNNGGIYLGESAGAVCQHHDLEPLKLADKPELAPAIVAYGLELTDIIIIPHWDNVKYHEVMEKIRNMYVDQQLETYPLNDNQVMFVDGEQIEIV